MPLNTKKIISILLEQFDEIEERCDGYKDRLQELTLDILEYEHAHRISAMNIQKKIDEKCNAVARYLAEQQQHSDDAGTEVLDP